MGGQGRVRVRAAGGEAVIHDDPTVPDFADTLERATRRDLFVNRIEQLEDAPQTPFAEDDRKDREE